MQYLALGIRCLIGAVFVVSSVSKVAGRGAFGAFAASVRDMRLLPPRLARPVARGVVVTEFAVCALVVVPAAAAAGLTLAAMLLGVFAAGITLAVRRGVRAPCRCFGVSATPLGPRQIARNLVLAAVAVLGAVCGALPTAGAVRWGGAAVAVSGGLLLGGLVAVLDDIFELYRPVPVADGRPRASAARGES